MFQHGDIIKEKQLSAIALECPTIGIIYKDMKNYVLLNQRKKVLKRNLGNQTRNLYTTPINSI